MRNKNFIAAKILNLYSVLYQITIFTHANTDFRQTYNLPYTFNSSNFFLSEATLGQVSATGRVAVGNKTKQNKQSRTEAAALAGCSGVTRGEV